MRRQELASACLLLLLTGTLSDILLVAGGRGRSSSGYKPNPGYKPKKGLSNKAKMVGAGLAGVAGGMVLGSVLSGAGRSNSHLRNNRYQMINGTLVDTWGNGAVAYPLGSLWLVSSMLLLTPCVSA
ncbi:uncharacterized protein LOC144610373 [Rhinoraja longicauda]